MAHGLNLHDGTGLIARDPTRGVLLSYGTTVPADGVRGYAPGSQFIKVDATSIGVTTYINTGTLASANFQASNLNGLTTVSFGYNVPDDQPIFVADRAYTIVGISGRVLVAGTGGACTAQIRRAPSGTAVASGTVVHSGTFNLVGTVDANQPLTVSSASLPSGNCLGLDVSGTPTSARGVITVVMAAA